MKKRVPKFIIYIILLLTVFHTTPVFASSMTEQEGTIYLLDEDALTNLLDENNSSNIVCSPNGISLEENALSGVYTTTPITMPEFSKIAISSHYENATEEQQPLFFVSVYRENENLWSEWILLPENENAKRTKSDNKTVLIKYQIQLSRNTVEEESIVIKNLLVSGGEHIFSQYNLTMGIVMLGALVVFLIRHKKYNSKNL